MMNRATGRRITAADHLRQSVADIITTPIGSRVMRRDYGSLVPALIDQPHNPARASRRPRSRSSNPKNSRSSKKPTSSRARHR